jgi:hypothetical protein
MKALSSPIWTNTTTATTHTISAATPEFDTN